VRHDFPTKRDWAALLRRNDPPGERSSLAWGIDIPGSSSVSVSGRIANIREADARVTLQCSKTGPRPRLGG